LPALLTLPAGDERIDFFGGNGRRCGHPSYGRTHAPQLKRSN
jgi:hypothetical protein